MSSYKQLTVNERKALRDSLQAQGQKYDHDETLETIHHHNQEALKANDHRFEAIGKVNHLHFPKVSIKEYESANLHSKHLDEAINKRKQERKQVNHESNISDNLQGAYNKVNQDKTLQYIVDNQYKNPLGFVNLVCEGQPLILELIQQYIVRSCRAGNKNKHIQAIQHRLYDRQASLANKSIDSAEVESEVYSEAILAILETPWQYCLTGYKQSVIATITKPVSDSIETCESVCKSLPCGVSPWLKKVIASGNKPGKTITSQFFVSSPVFISDRKFQQFANHESLMQVTSVDLLVLAMFQGYFTLEAITTIRESELIAVYNDKTGNYLLNFSSPIRASLKYHCIKTLPLVCYGKQQEGHLVYDETTGKYKRNKHNETNITFQSIHNQEEGKRSLDETLSNNDNESYDSIDLAQVIDTSCRKVSKKYKLSTMQEVNLTIAMQEVNQDKINVTKISNAIYGRANGKSFTRAKAIYESVLDILNKELELYDRITDKIAV